MAIASTPSPLHSPPGEVPRARGSRSATPVPSGGPSAFYRQHHAVETPQIDNAVFRPHWRVKTKLDKLFADGLIEAQVWQAAVAYRDLHLRAFAGMIGTIRLDGTGQSQPYFRGSRLERSEAQLAAIEKLRRIGSELGNVAVKLVEALVIDDTRWAQIGKRFRVDPKTAKTWCVTALQRLAEVW